METYTMTKEQIQSYAESLRMEERSESTVQKYANALTAFYEWLGEDKGVTKERLLIWKAEISAKNAASTVNVMISAVNSFFAFMSWNALRVKQVKTQRRIYRDAPAERGAGKGQSAPVLSHADARKHRNPHLGTAVHHAGGAPNRKRDRGLQRQTKNRPHSQETAAYCETAGIVSGSVFVTKRGNPVNRSNIWKELRALCDAACVEPSKVFPHNFRHLFAVSYYRMAKDVAKLADLLGHASIDTTRIYIMESGAEHERQMEKLGLVV